MAFVHDSDRARLNYVIIVLLLLLLSGCASGDGGQVISGVLQGIGAGLSGL